MAEILIKLDKEDITTSEIGKNIQVQLNLGNSAGPSNLKLSLIFTPEAMNELALDYKNILISRNQRIK